MRTGSRWDSSPPEVASDPPHGAKPGVARPCPPMNDRATPAQPRNRMKISDGKRNATAFWNPTGCCFCICQKPQSHRGQPTMAKVSCLLRHPGHAAHAELPVWQEWVQPRISSEMAECAINSALEYSIAGACTRRPPSW